MGYSATAFAACVPAVLRKSLCPLTCLEGKSNHDEASLWTHGLRPTPEGRSLQVVDTMRERIFAMMVSAASAFPSKTRPSPQSATPRSSACQSDPANERAQYDAMRFASADERDI